MPQKARHSLLARKRVLNNGGLSNPACGVQPQELLPIPVPLLASFLPSLSPSASARIPGISMETTPTAPHNKIRMVALTPVLRRRRNFHFEQIRSTSASRTCRFLIVTEAKTAFLIHDFS